VVIPYAVAKKDFKTLILPLSFLSFFLPNSLIFAKWTRFISPTFPYFAFLSVFFLSITSRVHQRVSHLLLLLIAAVSIYHGLSFFSIYTKENVRYAASRWIYENIPSKSFVLSETANVSDIPILPGSKWPDNYQLNPVSLISSLYLRVGFSKIT